jgi:hypothetical protein
VLLGACVPATQAAAADTTLKAPRFTTVYPSDWKRATERKRGTAGYTLTAPGTTVKQLGLPSAPGGAAITVRSWTTKAFRRDFHRRPPKRSGALLDAIVGIPRDATGVQDARRRKATRLAGARGAEVGFRYRFNGVENLQLDVVARHGSTVVFAELNMDPALGDAGLAPWRALRARWHWRSG